MVVEKETNKLLICIRIDSGGELWRNEFHELCKNYEIVRQKTIP